ncbi:hypothetical protein VTG60DRAFT_2266 [Thermothelomyces hinnuleus]
MTRDDQQSVLARLIICLRQHVQVPLRQGVQHCLRYHQAACASESGAASQDTRLARQTAPREAQLGSAQHGTAIQAGAPSSA